MATKLRVWKKQEKRTVKLLYRKGLLDDFELTELAWLEMNSLYPRRKYNNKQYVPEVCYFTSDYWGECNEQELIYWIKQLLHFENLIEEPDEDNTWGKSSFNSYGRIEFIKYLENLPTTRNDSKINNLLRIKLD